MPGIKEITLYSYYYSSASWRVRTVLAMKNIPFKYVTVHLLQGKQHDEIYVKLNPLQQVPALKVKLDNNETHILTQSLAIIEFLEREYPSNSIYPEDSILRAKCQAIADTISAGIQPLQNLETLKCYKVPLGEEGEVEPEERKVIAQYWLDRKLKHLDELVRRTSGLYCVGDQVTLADICLVPQMFNARRFEVDTSKYQTLYDIDTRLQHLDMFKAGHPLNCPDAPK